MKNRFRIAALWIASAGLAAAVAPSARAATIDEICRLVQAHGICLTSSTARAAVIGGMLKALDPEARLLAAGDLDAARQGASVGRCEEWPEGIGYLRVTALRDHGGHGIATQLVAWAAAGRTGAIIDLRGAGGHSLSSVADLAGYFTEAGQPLFRVKPLQGAIGDPQRPTAPAGTVDRLPTMLLVDGKTRDACAVMASTLKGRTAVMLIGAPTAAAPRAREFIPLSGGETVLIATGSVVGVDDPARPLASAVPDIAVKAGGAKAAAAPGERESAKPPSEKAIQDRKLMAKVAGDACLARATDTLLGLKAVGRRRAAAIEDAGGGTNSPAPAAPAATNAPAR